MGISMKKFQLHGESELYFEDNILLIEATGPWNIETMTDANKRVMPLIDKLSAGPWGALIIIYGEPIYVPDAATYLVGTIKELKKRGRIASAIMVEESNDPKFAKRHMSSIFEQAGETFRFFKQKQEAKSWLVQKITEARQDA
jgi:hypothetical protein